MNIHDNPRLEFAWTLLPTVFVVVLSVVSVYIWREINFGPNNGLVVQSIGHQFYFTFRYPQVNGEITDEMHLPVGVPVVLNLTSSDVIHSFWVPAMRIKLNGPRPGHLDAVHADPPGALQHHLRAVLRHQPRPDAPAAPRYRRSGLVR